MARNERAQWARLDIDGVALLADLAAGVSLARTLEFDGPQLRCFGAAAATSVPLVVGTFTARVEQGASCNCSVLTLTPHANCTHTETAAHLTRESLDAWRVIPQRLLVAVVLTVEPELAGEGLESSIPIPNSDDRLITRAALERAWPQPPSARLSARAAVIRSLPNARTKFTAASAAVAAHTAAAPFLTQQAAAELVARGIRHLVLDLPSADRAEDDGELTAHRIFFGLPRGSTRLAEAERADCTITELAYVEDAIADGWYLLSLQSPVIAGDAVPCRPLLYPLCLA